MIKAVLFDVDGVLIDTKKANGIFYQKLMVHFGYKRPTKNEVDALFGSTVIDAIASFARGA